MSTRGDSQKFYPTRNVGAVPAKRTDWQTRAEAAESRVADLEATVERLRRHKIADPEMAALHENAKQYSLANTALRERWGYEHSTTLAFLIDVGAIGPTDPQYEFTPRPGYPPSRHARLRALVGDETPGTGEGA
jgi:hypothetical protein